MLGQDVPVENPGVAFVAGCAVGALVASGTSLALTHRVASRVAREVAEERVPAWHTAEAAPVQADWSADTCENASESQVDEAPHAPRAAYAAHAAQTSGTRQAALAQQTAGVHQAVSVHQKNPTGQVLSSDDYADVAEAYVHSRTVAERMSSRAKGVAEVLSERLNASRMSGIPVIERADGSVGDVGEPWWDEAVAAHEGVASGPHPEAPTPAPVPRSPASAAQSVAPAWVEPQERTYASAAPAAAGPTPAVASQATRVMPSRDIISARIASPALDAAPGASVPANVTASSASAAGQRWDEEHQDLWAVALEALDERYQEQIGMGPDPDPEPVFSGDLGDGATLDEPDGLERSTKFMTFRPQAGHPEVTDADSYVNLLIRQEFAKSRSAHRLARRSFREHLKVIDGGTGEEPTSRLSGRHLVAQA
ncbi:hypothetical protein [uncultured Parolsenella sp.]|uniref:hypothetical protein n=1 Tax=uncultured Parolsenella sp. TaxID=2083008 RepID=UPI0027DBEB6D|nr:hypothetical protein [uncultured Parolsenella sp.]